MKKNGILLPKLFWPTMRKNCFSDREKLLKFEAECQEFAEKSSRSLEHFFLTVGQNNFGNKIAFPQVFKLCSPWSASPFDEDVDKALVRSFM